MAFTFDPNKNRENRRRHGVDFEQARKMWERPHVIIPAKNVSGEGRYAILGKIGENIHMGIFAMRDDDIRIISCHRADKKWERVYYEHIKKDEG